MEKQAFKMGVGVPDSVELKSIPGESLKYRAGSDGHIYCFSIARVNAKKPYPFILSEHLDPNGYPFVTLVINGQRISRRVHGLVCRAFNGSKPFPEAVVRHFDGIEGNSLPGNLKWGTYSENEADKRRHGTVACGEKQGNFKLTEEGVRILRASIPLGLWDVSNAAKVFQVDESTIRKIAKGESWKHIK